MAFAPLCALPAPAQLWEACSGVCVIGGSCAGRRTSPAGPVSRKSPRPLPAAAPALAPRARPQATAGVARGGSAPVAPPGASRGPTSAFGGTLGLRSAAGDVLLCRLPWAGRGIRGRFANAIVSVRDRRAGLGLGDSTFSGLDTLPAPAPACAAHAKEGGPPKTRRRSPKKAAAEDDGDLAAPSSPEPAAGPFDAAAARRFLRERCGLSDGDVDALLAKRPRLLQFDPAEAGRVVDLLEAAAGAGEAAGEEQPLAGDGASGPTAQRQKRLAQGAAQQRRTRLRGYVEHSIIRRSADEVQQRLSVWREGVGERGLKAIVRHCRTNKLLTYRVNSIQRVLQLFKEAGYTQEQIACIAKKSCISLQHCKSIGRRVDDLAAALELNKEMVLTITTENPYLLRLDLEANIEPKIALFKEWGMTRAEVVKLFKMCNLGMDLDTMRATFGLLRDGIFGGDAARARRTILVSPTLLQRKTSTVHDAARSLAEAVEGKGAPLSVVASLVCGSTVLHRNASTLAERVQGLRSMGVDVAAVPGPALAVVLTLDWERRTVPRLVARRLWGLEGKLAVSSFVKLTNDKAAARLGLLTAAYEAFVAACALLLAWGVPAPALYGLPPAALLAGPGPLRRRREAFEAAGGSGFDAAAFAAWLAAQCGDAEA